MYPCLVQYLPWLESLVPENRQEFEEELPVLLENCNLSEESLLKFLPWLERLQPQLLTQLGLSEETRDKILAFLDDWKAIAELDVYLRFLGKRAE